MQYTCRKLDLSSYPTKKIYLFFKNGDYVSFKDAEIVDVQLKTYDTLISYSTEFSAVAESGFIRLRVRGIGPRRSSHTVYNEDAYQRGRKQYIEDRCINEGAISHIQLFNENNFSRYVFGNIKAERDGGFLLLRFYPNPISESCDSEYHRISLAPIDDPEKIHSIDLSFENCESFTVYQDEIKDICLQFSDVLTQTSSAFVRTVIKGHIRLKLKNDNRRSRLARSWINSGIVLSNADHERRLCGSSADNVDICALYVTYMHPGYGLHQEEKINLRELIHKTCSDNEEYEPLFVTGYAKRCADGSILITFGKRLKASVTEAPEHRASEDY